ncbi:NIF family HAD-type phosphatase [Marinobacter salarius]|uniref:NIF family HAD-type phosphatase n=1 Tax=Marinobacter salarius TaxID=1420917 RepID=UPI000A1FD4CA
MNRQKHKTLLCMDLEGTLISNAISQIPRPGLYAFLENVAEVCDLMLYTSVSSARVNAIRNLLVNEGVAPAWFLDLSVCHPSATIKDKARCDLPPSGLTGFSLVMFITAEDDEHEKAILRRADHSHLEGSRSRLAGEGVVPQVQHF